MKDSDRHNTIPNNLSHRPIYTLVGYQAIDGEYKNNTDVIGLSLGHAQWDKHGFTPSVKVWRKIKDRNAKYRISRQSEETTLTRALDLALLTVKVLDGCLNNQSVKSINSLQGDIPIVYVGVDEEREELVRWVKAQENDLRAHIETLVNALREFENHSK